MSATMQYKEYLARVELDLDAGILHGEVINLRDVITFQATSIDQLRQELVNSVEEYLVFCAERNQEPDRPFSGNMLLRMPPEIHRVVATCAARAGVSINKWVVARLRECAAEERPQALATKVRTPWV